MDFAAYISGLPGPKRGALYRSPWTCLAVFRNLPPLAQVGGTSGVSGCCVGCRKRCGVAWRRWSVRGGVVAG